MDRDMHIHTTYSDGSMPPGEVVALAARLGLSEIAITDHDTMAGCGEAVEAGKTVGVKVVPGVEISAFDYARGRKVHLLGYGIRDVAALENGCTPFRQSRHQAQMQAAGKVAAAGYPVGEREALAYTGPAGTLYRQHIMHALVDRGYCRTIYCELYNKLFAKGGLAFVPSEYMDVFTALELIKKTGGKAVLAHPYQYNSIDLLPELKDRGLWGLEVRHSKHSNSEIDSLSAMAERYRLEPYAGSDFHGFYNEQVNPLGSICQSE